jgi:integration host factor subunit alpha
MTKAEIVQALHGKIRGLSKKEAADFVDMAFDIIKDTLSRGEKVKLSGFGNFVLRDKKPRPGRNPQTGEPIEISERRVMTFKPSQVLKQALNPRSGDGAATAASNGAKSAASAPRSQPAATVSPSAMAPAAQGVAPSGMTAHGAAAVGPASGPPPSSMAGVGGTRSVASP